MFLDRALSDDVERSVPQKANDVFPQQHAVLGDYYLHGIDGYGSAVGEGVQRDVEAAFGEHGGVDATGTGSSLISAASASFPRWYRR